MSTDKQDQYNAMQQQQARQFTRQIQVDVEVQSRDFGRNSGGEEVAAQDQHPHIRTL